MNTRLDSANRMEPVYGDDANSHAAPPLIVHVVHRLDTGGMERLLVDLIQRSPARFRHAVVSMTDSGPLGRRLEGKARRYALHKREGKDFGAYIRLWRLLRRLRPAMVQTYNFGCIDAAAVAWLAGVPRRLHAEHGWNADDAGGSNRKYRWLRRVLKPFIHRYIAVSSHVARWLERDVGIPSDKVACIRNGIYTARFQTEANGDSRRGGWPEKVADGVAVGTVGRLDEVKDQRTLLRAFRLVCDRCDQDGEQPRLVLIGDGPMRHALEREAARLGLADRTWFAGQRDDIPELLAGLDVFALSSISEGIPLSVLEAMAAGRAVVSTAVGGVPEVVIEDECGQLVPPRDPDALATALLQYIRDPGLRARHAEAGQRRVESRFNASAMVETYFSLYDEMIRGCVSPRELRSRQKQTEGM